MLARLADGSPVEEILLVGNTAMHHFFSGLSVEPLASVPFRSPAIGAQRFEAEELGWSLELRQPACFLPCVGGFVGSDLLAGLVATGLVEAAQPGAFWTWGPTARLLSAIETGFAAPRRRPGLRSKAGESAWACVPAAGRSTGCRFAAG